MPPDGPLMLGPFAVGTDGRLGLDGASAGFSLRWRGRMAHARLDRAGQLGFALVLGRVPSSAGALAGARHGAFTALAGLRRGLPAGWHVALRADHRALAETSCRLDLPTSAGALLAAVTAALLDLAPYLAALDAAAPLFEPPGASVGSVNTWPG